MRTLKMKKLLKNQAGVTLLEVLVAMILTSFGLMMLLNMAMIALDGNDWSNKTTMATQALQEKLEQIRGQGVALAQSGSDSVGDLARTWRITSAGSHLRRVDVTVTWTDIKSETHSDQLTTFVRTDSL